MSHASQLQGAPRNQGQVKSNRFAAVRCAPVWVILLAIAANYLSAAWFKFPPFMRPIVRLLQDVSGGIVQPFLVLHAILLLIVIGLIAMGLGRLRLADLGLRARGILPALLLWAGLWGLIQTCGLLVTWADGQSIVWNRDWVDAPGATAGRLLGFCLGVGLYEELVFRGLLFTQCEVRLARVRRAPTSAAGGAALLVSSAVFAAGHLPYLLRHSPIDELAAGLGLIFAWGVVFASVYWLTGNVLCSVAVHALVEGPGLFAGEPGKIILMPVVLCSAIAAACWRTWRTHRCLRPTPPRVPRRREPPVRNPRVRPPAR